MFGNSWLNRIIAGGLIALVGYLIMPKRKRFRFRGMSLQNMMSFGRRMSKAFSR